MILFSQCFLFYIFFYNKDVKYDVTIIGAGIIGSLIAHNLSKYNLNVLIVDKGTDVATGATAANSAMVHSGHDPKDGTLKCKYNLLGNRMYPDLCKELKVSFAPVGAFVVATSDSEIEKLEVLIKQCEDRKIPHEVLTGQQAHELEPNLADSVCKALSLPTTGVITPWEVTIAACEEAMMNGVELKLSYEVKDIKKVDDKFIINDEIETTVLINAAGVHCDDITNMLRVSPYKVEGKKGEYYILDHTGKMLVNHVIYPLPSEKGKGVLAVPTVHNNVLLGPNSDFVEDRDDTSTGSGLDYVKSQITKTIKNIPYNRMVHNYAGIRPHIDLNDFYIQEDDQIKNFIHVAGIESPGISAAPAIAKDVVENLVIPKFNPTVKENYSRRKAFVKMNEMSEEEKKTMIENNPDFGKIICRCENISLGEIKDCINRKCGATTMKGVRIRVRSGMGRCQGSFCEPEVFNVLQHETNLDPKAVKFNKDNSEIVMSYAKENI